MATPSISTTYVGKGALDFVTPALLNGKTIQGKYITVIPNVKKSYKLQIADLSNVIQADSGCSFNDQGQVTISERSLSPVKLKVNLEECRTTLESHWQAEMMISGAMNSNQTEAYKAFLTKKIQAQVAIGIDRLIWIGNLSGGTAGIYATFPFLTTADGIFTKAVADSATVKQTGTTLTSSNILAELDKVIAKIPDATFFKGEVKIFMAYSALRLFRLAIPQTYLANSNFNIQNTIVDKYREIELVGVPLADNKMLAAEPANLFFGTDLLDDDMEYKIIDLYDTTGDNKIRVIMRFSADQNYAISSEVVVYN